MTPKQQCFVDEYLIDLNATQAAIRAEYSEQTAYSLGQRLLKNAEVQAAITEAQAARSERTQIDQDYVLARLKEEAERIEGGSPGARVRALELLGRHLGMFVERHELTGKDGGPVETQPAVEIKTDYAALRALLQAARAANPPEAPYTM